MQCVTQQFTLAGFSGNKAGTGRKSIPKRHEGEAEEEPEGAPELGHQGGEGVDQLLGLHAGVVNSPQPEHKVIGWEGGGLLFP